LRLKRSAGYVYIWHGIGAIVGFIASHGFIAILARRERRCDVWVRVFKYRCHW
jgi:hypothetical protein